MLIPGGFEEKGGSDGLAAGVRAALDEARATPSCGPLVLGGNCLGFRSRAGRCDTLFIPEYKLPVPDGHPHPLALVSQSGAFAVARADRWGSLSPAYVITTGNQIDLTIGDCLAWLKDEGDVRVFAVYVEGFKPLDGARTLDAAAEIARSGRTWSSTGRVGHRPGHGPPPATRRRSPATTWSRAPSSSTRAPSSRTTWKASRMWCVSPWPSTASARPAGGSRRCRTPDSSAW